MSRNAAEMSNSSEIDAGWEEDSGDGFAAPKSGGGEAAVGGQSLKQADQMAPPPGIVLPDRSFRSQAVRGSAWLLASQAASQVMRLGGNLVLTRILPIELFGIMLTVNILLRSLVMFCDVGIYQSVVQNKRGDESAFFNTAWTLQVGRGFLLWIVSCAIAWPWAMVQGEPDLVWLIPVAATSAILNGLASTSLMSLSRHVIVNKTTMIQLTAQIFSLVVMIALAVITRSIWALVAGSIADALIRFALSFSEVPGYRNKLMIDKTAAREIFHFGKWIFFSTALTFLAGYSDKLIMTVLIDDTALLGAFAIAVMVIEAPNVLIKRMSQRVIFPIISRKRDLPRHELRSKVIESRRKLLMAGAFGVAVLMVFGDVIIGLLWPDAYADAGWILSILAFGLWLSILLRSTGPALMAFGKPNYNTIGGALSFAWVAIGLPTVYYMTKSSGGNPVATAVMFMATAELPNYIVNRIGLRREGMKSDGQDLAMTGVLLAVIALLLGGRLLAGIGMPWQAVTL